MKFALLVTTNSREEAMVIESKLAAMGIDCMIEQESVGRLYGLSQNGLGEMRIMVDADRFEDAAKIIAD